MHEVTLQLMIPLKPLPAAKTHPQSVSQAPTHPHVCNSVQAPPSVSNLREEKKKKQIAYIFFLQTHLHRGAVWRIITSGFTLEIIIIIKNNRNKGNMHSVLRASQERTVLTVCLICLSRPACCPRHCVPQIPPPPLPMRELGKGRNKKG